jgi:hypothetical protein
MTKQSHTYEQRLPALELSIQQNTVEVPQDGYYYVLRAGEIVGRYRNLKAAQDAWREIRDREGWKPPKRQQLSASEKLKREKVAKERSEYFEYWNSGRRHSW